MAKTFIKCKNCGHEEQITSGLLRKAVMGGAIFKGGTTAWSSYLFAGSGIAYPLCVAIGVGGACLAVIPGLRHLLARLKPCPECGFKDWEVYAVDDKPKKYRTMQKF